MERRRGSSSSRDDDENEKEEEEEETDAIVWRGLQKVFRPVNATLVGGLEGIRRLVDV